MEIIPLIVGALAVNCYIVGDKEKNEWAVIDPGGDLEKILGVIKKKNARVKFIINTHGHPDHTGADSKIKQETGAPLYIHKADATLTTGIFNQLARLTGINGSSFKPDHFLEDGDTLSLGDISLKVLHTPGHTRGGICLFFDNVLFCGDTLFAGSIGRTDLPGGSLPTLLKSIKEKLFSLPDDVVVYPGHGPQTTLGEEKRSNPFLF
ncbi:MAG: MBL fold metallo-hydrolase [Candidatus Omnitrophica bacterium]|nr:MBL fold metallo-hydrolase [Candidatus Omnitrophota bacterium]